MRSTRSPTPAGVDPSLVMFAIAIELTEPDAADLESPLVGGYAESADSAGVLAQQAFTILENGRPGRSAVSDQEAPRRRAEQWAGRRWDQKRGERAELSATSLGERKWVLIRAAGDTGSPWLALFVVAAVVAMVVAVVLAVRGE